MRHVRNAWRINVDVIGGLWGEGMYAASILFALVLPLVLPVMMLNGIRRGWDEAEKSWREEAKND